MLMKLSSSCGRLANLQAIFWPLLFGFDEAATAPSEAMLRTFSDMVFVIVLSGAGKAA